MTTVLITRGCNQETAEQFMEGTDTYVRVCDPATAQLVIFTADPVTAIVRVDGEEIFKGSIEPEKRNQFALSALLNKSKRLARSGFLSMISFSGNEDKTCVRGTDPSGRLLAEAATGGLFPAFTLEIRQGLSASGPLTATYKFQLLEEHLFDKRFNGFVSSRKRDEPCPVFTRDARPVDALNATPRCAACGYGISDPLTGCENANCPTAAH
ncbi:hypothetical protein BH11CYA1_BH11CYA1_46160 [soil metagenome]